jgi:hypothetical protein
MILQCPVCKRIWVVEKRDLPGIHRAAYYCAGCCERGRTEKGRQNPFIPQRIRNLSEIEPSEQEPEVIPDFMQNQEFLEII